MDASDVIIPCSQGPVVASNRVLARVTVVISDNHQDLFSDINHSSLRSITGLLAATKPLSHTQAQQLHLLGLSLYLAANQHEGMQINPTLDTLTEDYNNVPPVLDDYHDPTYHMWYQQVMCWLESIRAEAAL